MRRTSLILCFFLMIATAFRPARAQTRPTAAPEEIQSLIASLSSDDEPTRKQAIEKLVALGEQARPALESTVRGREAAREALQRIDADKVAGPTLVSLHLTDTPGDEAIKELARRSGYELRTFNEEAWKQGRFGSVTLSMDNQPFWAAMKELGRQAGVIVYYTGNNDRRIVLMPASMGGQNFMLYPASINGAFLTLIPGIQRTNIVQFAQPQNVQRNMQLQLQVLVEPKVKIIQFSYTPEIDAADDDNGNSLLKDKPVHNGPPRHMNMSSGRGLLLNGNASLEYPASNPGSKIQLLRGRFRALVQTRSQSLEVNDPLHAKETSQNLPAGRRLVFKGLKKLNDQQFQADIVAYRGTSESQAFNESMNNPAVRLLDSQGRELTPSGGNGNSTADEYSRQMMFFRNARPGDSGVPGEPTKLIWEWPTDTQEIFIPFEFKDLPMP